MIEVTVPVRKDGTALPRRLEARDQLLDALVASFERVLAEDGPLRLVVELQVHPVDGVIALALLGSPHELTAQPRTRRLRRRDHRKIDVLVGDGTINEPVMLEPVVEPPLAVDV